MLSIVLMYRNCKFCFEKWIFVLYLYLYFSLLNFEGLKIYSGNDQIIKIGRGYYIGIVATAFVVLTVTTFILFKCCGYFFFGVLLFCFGSFYSVGSLNANAGVLYCLCLLRFRLVLRVEFFSMQFVVKKKKKNLFHFVVSLWGFLWWVSVWNAL